MSVPATVCPRCGELTQAVWREVPPEPGFYPAYRLSHRRRGGARCEAYRGPPLDYAGQNRRATLAATEHAEVYAARRRHGS